MKIKIEGELLMLCHAAAVRSAVSALSDWQPHGAPPRLCYCERLTDSAKTHFQEGEGLHSWKPSSTCSERRQLALSEPKETAKGGSPPQTKKEGRITIKVNRPERVVWIGGRRDAFASLASFARNPAVRMVSSRDHKARKEFLTSDLRVLIFRLIVQRFRLFGISAFAPAQSY